MSSSICLYSQVYTDETASFIFYIKERHTGNLSKYSPEELISNKKIMAQLPYKHRIRIAYIAGFEWAEQNSRKIAEFKLIKRAASKASERDKKPKSINCNKTIQDPKVS